MQCISLIGMPGAGKSTIGKPLAKALGFHFVDTDVLLEQRFGMRLQTWLEQHDYLALRQQEEQLLLTQQFARCVIATGGSVVYSEASMRKLSALGPCIFLDISFATMLQRIGTGADRGLAIASSTGLAEMYAERKPLYQHWAQFTVNGNTGSADEVLDEIMRALPPILHDK